MIGLLGADTIRGEGGDDNVQANEDLDKCMARMAMTCFKGSSHRSGIWRHGT